MNCPIRARTEWEKANPITLVGGNRPYHIMSVLLAEHSRSEGIFGFLTYKDANSLRLVCKELRDEVSDFRWMDSKTRINGSLKLWRTCFRNAKAANVSMAREHSYHDHISDSEFVYLRGIHTLNMSKCNDEYTITDAAFVHLKGIHTLNMSCCKQDTITDAAFVHLKGIHTLDMSHCNQITDAAIVHLKGIHTLNTYGCDFTDAIVVHLKGIHTLHISSWSITTASIVHLKGIHTLFTDIWNLSPDRISAKDFAHLKGIHTLGIGYFCQGGQYCHWPADLLGYLEGISILDLRKDGCRPIWEYDWVNENENEYMTNFNLTQYVKYAMDRDYNMSDSNYAMK